MSNAAMFEALIKERLEENGLAETVRGLAILLQRDPAARRAFEALVELVQDPGT